MGYILALKLHTETLNGSKPMHPCALHVANPCPARHRFAPSIINPKLSCTAHRRNSKVTREILGSRCSGAVISCAYCCFSHRLLAFVKYLLHPREILDHAVTLSDKQQLLCIGGQAQEGWWFALR